jgi:exosortase
VSGNTEITKRTAERNQFLGLWPHEIAFLALLAAAFYFSQIRGPWWPPAFFFTLLLGALPLLIFRCREEWRRLPNRFLFFLLLAAWLAFFSLLGNSTFGYLDSSSLFLWMFDIYTSPTADEQQGMILPFVVFVLLWWKRKELVAQPAKLWPPAIGLIALGLLIHVVGYVIQQPRVSVVGFFAGLYGLTGLAWGKHWLKASLFPFFLFAFCMPIGQLADPLTMPLRLLVAKIVVVVARTALALPPSDLIREGTQLFNASHTFAYEVAAACSGIRSIVALLALMTIYGFVNFQTPWKRAAMMLAALPLAVLGNVVRLCCTITVAEFFGQDAGKMVETNLGFITFAVAIGCAFLLARWLEKGEPKLKTETQPAPA